jgi:hypothetical protein
MLKSLADAEAKYEVIHNTEANTLIRNFDTNMEHRNYYFTSIS